MIKIIDVIHVIKVTIPINLKEKSGIFQQAAYQTFLMIALLKFFYSSLIFRIS